MLVRELPDGAALCIGQASHAWLSGQLARVWDPAPGEELCLAALQHDIGMAEWDLAPAPDPDTGWPVSFMRMELPEHVALWTAAPDKLLSQSHHAALFVSLHGTRLYEMRDLDRLAPADAELVRGYLDGQRALQRRLADELGLAEPEIRRDQTRVFFWDGLSLALCLGWAPWTSPEVDGHPRHLAATADGPDDGLGGAHTLDPWPFAVDELEVRCEGRVLRTRATDRDGLRAALEAAERVDLRYRLTPG